MEPPTGRQVSFQLRLGGRLTGSARYSAVAPSRTCADIFVTVATNNPSIQCIDPETQVRFDAPDIPAP